MSRDTASHLCCLIKISYAYPCSGGVHVRERIATIRQWANLFNYTAEYLDDANLISHVERIVIRRQTHVRLLQAIWPYERVNFRNIDVVEPLYGKFDLL